MNRHLFAANVFILEPFSSQSPPTCSFNQNTGISAYLGHKGTNQGANFADPSTKPKPQGSGLCWKNLMGENRKLVYQPCCTKKRASKLNPGLNLWCVDVADLEWCINKGSGDEYQACDGYAVSPQKTKTSISRLTMKTRSKAKSAHVPPETSIHGQHKQRKHQETKRKALLPTDAVQ